MSTADMNSQFCADPIGHPGDQLSDPKLIEDSPTTEILPDRPQGAHSGVPVHLPQGSSDSPHAVYPDHSRAAPTFNRARTGTRESRQRELAVGSVLRSRYVLEDVIGRGGDSIVFRAQDLHRLRAEEPAGGAIAIKALLPEQRANVNALTRLKREFWQMQSLTHAGIARVFDLDRENDIWFMSMELVAGQTLNAWMPRTATDAQCLQVISGCCDALAHAHSLGVLHGDLKPSNVLICPDGSVKLIDFGAAPSPGAVLGAGSDPSIAATAPYASPQVLAGHEPEQSDDIFSLACLSYAILSRGGHPFGRKSSLEALRAQMQPTHVAGIPPPLFQVLARGLAPERGERPASVREFLSELIGSELGRCLVAASEYPPAQPEPATTRYNHTSTVDAPEACSAQSAPTEHAALANIGGRPATRPIEATPRPPDPPAPRGLTSTVMKPAAPIALSASRNRSRGSSASHWRTVLRMSLTGIAAMIISTGIVATVVLGRQAMQRSIPVAPESSQSAPARAPDAAMAAAVTDAAPPSLVAAVDPQTLPEVTSASRAPGAITFESSAMHAESAQSLIAIPLKRLQSTRGRALIMWTTDGGTAQPYVDYEPVDHQVAKFIEGQAVRSLFIRLLKGGTMTASNRARTIDVTLQRVGSGPAIGPVARITVTIGSSPNGNTYAAVRSR